MSIHSINRVQLAFPKGGHDAVRRFYGALVGLTELKYPVDDALHFVAGSQRVDLVPTDQWLAPSSVSVLAFEVKNLPRLRHQLLSANVPLEEQNPLPGYLRFYAQDPAGNRLEFLEPDPHSTHSV